MDARPAGGPTQQPTALGVGRLSLHHLYVFSSGGLGGGIGDGASINLDAGPDPKNVGSIYQSKLTNLHVSGGLRLRNVGDSNQLDNLRMDGKGGIVGSTVPGAVETKISNVNYAGGGPVLIWRGGSKLTLQKFNAE